MGGWLKKHNHGQRGACQPRQSAGGTGEGRKPRRKKTDKLVHYPFILLMDNNILYYHYHSC